MKKGRGMKGLIIGVILLCLVIGYYYYLSNRRSDKTEDDAKLTAVQEVLLRNLDNNYPPTPREAVKYFGEIAQCVYGGTYTEEEFQQLAAQAKKLYDAELLANNPDKQYIENLKWDVDDFKNQEIVISSFSPSSSTDVEYFTQDGYSWAQLRCVFSLRKGTQLASAEEIFLLRKDETGHWKIYGWTLAGDEAGAESGK